MEVIQIFVSCPGDVTNEKHIVKDVCERLNAVYLDRLNISFVVRDWKEIVGEVGCRPQEIINQAFQKCKIYLGIMWMRFGTPTGGRNNETGEEFMSGTEEEYELAYKIKKDSPDSISLVFFFKEQATIGGSIEQYEQAKRVLQFKERVSKDWYNEYPKSDGEVAFNNLVYDYLSKYALDFARNNKHRLKAETSKEVDVTKFTQNIPAQKCYIQRTFSLSSIRNNHPSDNIINHDPTDYLHQIVEKHDRVIILGNAGSGKSIELQGLANYFRGLDTSLVPVYAKFNNYTDENIEEFLPEGWENLRAEITLIIIDGLDEVQPQHFNTAIRKIQKFSERYKTVKMVLSSRTNFYELPTANFSGTLSDFNCYFLKELTIGDASKYYQCKTGENADGFIREVYSESLIDLLGVPFFLNILIDVYTINGSLGGGRAALFSQFIDARFERDLEHYKATVTIKERKAEILSMLSKIALVMEASGAHTISSDNIAEVLRDSGDIKLLKYSTVFNMENDFWAFEHNNIKEFLAAKQLLKLPVEKVKSIISYPPEYKKLKPSWVNTLSFLMSIANQEYLNQILNWVIEIEPEIVIKFEAEKISEALRFEIFKRIFCFYKDKNIWLRSNKFSDKELAQFAFSSLTLEYLINELSISNSRTVKLNALRIIESIKEELPKNVMVSLRELLIHLLDEFSTDYYAIYSILLAIAKTNVYDEELVNKLVERYKNRRNQYIRTGLYKLIIHSKKVDDFINIFFDGIYMSNRRDNDDRETVILGDEDYSIKKALMSVESQQAVRKAIQFFSTKDNNRVDFFRSKSDIIRSLLSKAVTLYNSDNSIFNDVLDFYELHSRTHQREYLKYGQEFFEKTDTKLNAIYSIIYNKKIDSYYKGILIGELVDREVIDKLFIDYQNHDTTNDILQEIFTLIHWYYPEQNYRYHLVEYFEEKIHKETKLTLQKKVYVDYNKEYQNKKQHSFALLFSSSDFITELERFFTYLERETFSRNDLWEHKAKKNNDLENFFPECVLTFLREFVDGDESTNIQKVRAWIHNEDGRFNNYLRDTIYISLRNDKELVVNKEQLEKINHWVAELLEFVDIRNSFTVSKMDNSDWQVNRSADMLWVFLKKTSFNRKDKRTLDFTLFDDYYNNDGDSPIEILTQHYSRFEVNQKVVENLQQQIPVVLIWSKNALYALSNSLEESYKYILEGIRHNSASEYYVDDVLKEYFNRTKDVNSLKLLLGEATSARLKWVIVDILLSYKENNFLETVLLKWMRNGTDTLENRLKVANYLIQLNNTEGLIFYIEYSIESYRNTKTIVHEIASISSYDRAEGIAYLITLLHFGKTAQLPGDRFYRFDALALDGLHSIGIRSAENLALVKGALVKFIEDNTASIENINYLHFNIEKMEDVYYSSNKGHYSLEEAISEISQIVG